MSVRRAATPTNVGTGIETERLATAGRNVPKVIVWGRIELGRRMDG